MIDVTRDGPVATVWLSRPEKRNAMSYDMWVQLERVCHELAVDTGVRAVVLRGRGDHFCAGADITELTAVRAAGAPSFMAVNMAAETALASMPKPVVAFVHGDCIGGGCSLAVACDLRLAVVGSRFGITPAKLGIVYPPASLERVVRLVGPSTAKQLLYTADLFDTARAAATGLVDEVLAGAMAEQRLAELCATLAQRSLLTQVGTKEMVDAISAEGSVPSEMAARWAHEVDRAGDLAEGVAAFVERRPPSFTWTGRTAQR